MNIQVVWYLKKPTVKYKTYKKITFLKVHGADTKNYTSLIQW